MMVDDWANMTGYGYGHWLFFVIMVAVVLYPAGRILNRLGLSPFWSVLIFVPLVNVISLWILAFIDWPASTIKMDRGREV